MSNELILVLSLLIIYSTVLFSYVLFGRIGLIVWTAIATITANIEVLMLVEAFGLEQTLGNILFGSTFLVTDILSEVSGKKDAKKAVNIGIFTSIIFVVITQSWFLYAPSSNDWASESIYTLFANTPRIMLSSIFVFAVVQKFDVWLYHKIWKLTENKVKDKNALLWVRNNASTLISQLINSILFTFMAFGDLYDFGTLVTMTIATYVVFIVTSIADTPFVYIARKLKENNIVKSNE